MSMRDTVPICNSMYSFHRLMKAGKLDTLGVPKLCADLGIHLLEVNPTYLPTDEPGLERFERALEEAGCGVRQMTCDFPLCRMASDPDSALSAAPATASTTCAW